MLPPQLRPFRKLVLGARGVELTFQADDFGPQAFLVREGARGWGGDGEGGVEGPELGGGSVE